jgi:hypothetical protein
MSGSARTALRTASPVAGLHTACDRPPVPRTESAPPECSTVGASVPAEIECHMNLTYRSVSVNAVTRCDSMEFGHELKSYRTWLICGHASQIRLLPGENGVVNGQRSTLIRQIGTEEKR